MLGLLLYKAAFQRLEETLLCLIHIYKHRKSDKKIEEYLSNKETRKNSRGEEKSKEIEISNLPDK